MDFPNLHFTEGGWCEALKTSYTPGAYRPKTKAEYLALAPFAVDAPEITGDEPEAPEDAPDKRGPGRPKRV